MTTATPICAQLDGLLLFAYPNGPPEPDWHEIAHDMENVVEDFVLCA